MNHKNAVILLLGSLECCLPLLCLSLVLLTMACHPQSEGRYFEEDSVEVAIGARIRQQRASVTKCSCLTVIQRNKHRLGPIGLDQQRIAQAAWQEIEGCKSFYLKCTRL